MADQTAKIVKGPHTPLNCEGHCPDCIEAYQKLLTVASELNECVNDAWNELMFSKNDKDTIQKCAVAKAVQAKFTALEKEQNG